MDYGSISTVVVLTIVVIIIIGWLPKRTVDSMKRVVEHREDRFSSSLHLVDARSATRFSDERALGTKGAIMQPRQSHEASLSRQRITEIRRRRHEAVRRRRAIVVSLFAAAVLVAALSFPLRFSVAFALIPLALAILVLGLGVRASSHAREWERSVRGHGANAHQSRGSTPRPAPSITQRGRSRESAPERHIEEEDASDASGSTMVMQQRDIRRALHRARQEHDEALARRERARSRAAGEGADAAGSEKSDADKGSATRAVADKAPSSRGIADKAPEENAAAHDAARRGADPVEDDHAGVSQQDLISFSLGAPRNGHAVCAQEPQSMEIRSTRRVATDGASAVGDIEAAAGDSSVASDAALADGDETDSSVSDGSVLSGSVSGSAGQGSADAAGQPTGPALIDGSRRPPADVDGPQGRHQVHSGVSSDTRVSGHRTSAQAGAGVNDTQAFHECETHAHVDTPKPSRDSLSVGLESILARRGQ
jgi:hypothetical protein